MVAIAFIVKVNEKNITLVNFIYERDIVAINNDIHGVHYVINHRCNRKITSTNKNDECSLKNYANMVT